MAIANTIRRFIEQNLDSPELDVDLILKQFGVSRASLYRIFESANGVRQYISNRRLHRAVVELSEAPMERGRVGSIAEKWNFSSAGNFNRAVRREFDITPGNLFDLDDLELRLTEAAKFKHDGAWDSIADG